MDLRERAVRSVEVDGLSRRAAAARFGLGVSTVINSVRRVRETGSVRPGRVGGHKPRKIAGDHPEWLLGRCRERDFTLRGLVAELGELGLSVDYREGFRMPAGREQWTRYRGRRPKASEERTRGRAASSRPSMGI
jgi:putative transposase